MVPVSTQLIAATEVTGETELWRLAVAAVSRSTLADTEEETARIKRDGSEFPTPVASVRAARARTLVAAYASANHKGYPETLSDIVSCARKLRDARHTALQRWVGAMLQFGNDPVRAYSFLSTRQDETTQQYAQAATLTYEEACQELFDQLWEIAYVVGLGNAIRDQEVAGACRAVLAEARAALSASSSDQSA